MTSCCQTHHQTITNCGVVGDRQDSWPTVLPTAMGGVKRTAVTYDPINHTPFSLHWGPQLSQLRSGNLKGSREFRNMFILFQP